MDTDSGPPPKMIPSGTYLQRIAFAEQFLEGDITSSGRVRLVWGCNGDKPALYLGQQRVFEGGERGRRQDASSQLCVWSSLDRSDVISNLLGNEEFCCVFMNAPSSTYSPLPLQVQNQIPW